MTILKNKKIKYRCFSFNYYFILVQMFKNIKEKTTFFFLFKATSNEPLGLNIKQRFPKGTIK